MSTQSTIIDDIMGFNPQEVFNKSNQPAEKRNNATIYKTNPKNSVSEDGHYHSQIRVLLNPFNLERSIVHQATYAMTDGDGFFMVKSALGDGDKNCPLFRAWKQLWFSGDNEKKEWSKQKFDKSETDWVLVQIIEDENQPELTGQFKVMKMPKAIMSRLQAKMNPTDGKKAPQPIMDYLFGPVLEMNVTPGPDDPANPGRKNREISYDLCDFANDPTPIISVDGTPLFNEDEMEVIETYAQAQADILKAKTEGKRKAAEEVKASLSGEVRKLYEKALEYMKSNALDLVDECAYKPWSDNVTARVNAWIEAVLNMEDPLNVTTHTKTEEVKQSEGKASASAPVKPESSDDDLPF